MKMRILDTLVSEVLARSPRLQQLHTVVNDLAVELRQTKETLLVIVHDFRKMQMALYHHGQAIKELHEFQGQVAQIMRKNAIDVSMPLSKKPEEHKPN